MPTSNPTGYETYIYDHGPLHDSPRIMVEPCYESQSKDVWLYFRDGPGIMLPRLIAEQLRDALIKVCQK